MGFHHQDYFPKKSLGYLDNLVSPSERKLRLLTMECDRHCLDPVKDAEHLAVLELVTSYLDGHVTHTEMFDALENSGQFRETILRLARPTVMTEARTAITNGCQGAAKRLKERELAEIQYGHWTTEPGKTWWRIACEPIPAEDAKRLAWIVDIFGSPEGAQAFPESWRTEHTLGLAAKMYDDRDFCAMPILADALEEAGCDNADILTHCREPGVHVRGCWVVDLVLGK